MSEVTSKYEDSCEHVQCLQQSLAEETHKHRIIEQRFCDLAKNHEEMICFKDEYKGEVKRLQCELTTQRKEYELRMERSIRLEEEVSKIEGQYQEKMKDAERRVALLEEQKHSADDTITQLQTNAWEFSNMLQQLQEKLGGLLHSILGRSNNSLLHSLTGGKL